MHSVSWSVLSSNKHLKCSASSLLWLCLPFCPSPTSFGSLLQQQYLDTTMLLLLPLLPFSAHTRHLQISPVESKHQRLLLTFNFHIQLGSSLWCICSVPRSKTAAAGICQKTFCCLRKQHEECRVKKLKTSHGILLRYSHWHQNGEDWSYQGVILKSITFIM